MTTPADAFYERASWPVGTPVVDPDNPGRRGQLVRPCARLWVDRDSLPPMVRWHGSVKAEEVPWASLRRAASRIPVTINCAGNGGRAATVHRAHEDDPSKATRLFPLCPGGTRAAKQARVVYQATDRMVNCARCLDIMAPR